MVNDLMSDKYKRGMVDTQVLVQLTSKSFFALKVCSKFDKINEAAHASTTRVAKLNISDILMVNTTYTPYVCFT